VLFPARTLAWGGEQFTFKKEHLMQRISHVLIVTSLIASGCGGDRDHQGNDLSSGVAAAAAVNILSGVAVNLFSSALGGDGKQAVTESDLAPRKLGSALPKHGVDELSSGERKSKEFTSRYKDDVKIRYRIEYQYGLKHKGRGAYIKDVVFIPLAAEIAEDYSLKATSISQDPEISKDGKVALRFVITFTTKTPKSGIKVTSHRFLIRAHDGDLVAVTPELDQRSM